MSLTTDPTDPRLGRGVDEEPRPQNDVYLVLSPEELAKGYVRPFRDTYVHVGYRPKYPLRDLTLEELELYGHAGYVKYEEYPAGSPERETSLAGRFWTQAQITNKGCGAYTKMGHQLSATYARDPHFYGSTYCVGCCKHLPVEEFVWAVDGQVVGS